MAGDGSQRTRQTLPTDFLLSIPAVDTLQRIWKQDYLPQDKGGTWIAEEDRLEAARLFSSPYEPFRVGGQEALHILDWVQGAFHRNL